jgi:mRNA interferase HigB
VVQKARWNNFAEVRETFRRASLVKLPNGKNVVIFDIGGNKFRLITFIQYQTQLVVVAQVLTHSEYDTDKWKDEI